MSMIRNSLVTLAALAALGAQAQTQGTTQQEMQRGVPGVDVDAGRNADGAIDVNRANTERARGVPGVDVDAGGNADGATDVNRTDRTTRPARADRG